MVSPRTDMWSVTGRKPENRSLFDENVEQPLQSFSRFLGYNKGESSHMVYEVFPTEDEAKVFADQIKELGATSVNIAPPRTRQSERRQHRTFLRFP